MSLTFSCVLGIWRDVNALFITIIIILYTNEMFVFTRAIQVLQQAIWFYKIRTKMKKRVHISLIVLEIKDIDSNRPH